MLMAMMKCIIQNTVNRVLKIYKVKQLKIKSSLTILWIKLDDLVDYISLHIWCCYAVALSILFLYDVV